MQSDAVLRRVSGAMEKEKERFTILPSDRLWSRARVVSPPALAARRVEPLDHGGSVLLGVVRVVRGVERPIRQLAHRVVRQLLADGESLGPLGRGQP